MGVIATGCAGVKRFATLICARVVVSMQERFCARAKSWGSCDCGGGCDCPRVSQRKEGARSRPRPTERVGVRIEKIERGASKGTHAEQKTTWWGAMRQWRGTEQTMALTTKLRGSAKARLELKLENEETTAHILNRSIHHHHPVGLPGPLHTRSSSVIGIVPAESSHC